MRTMRVVVADEQRSIEALRGAFAGAVGMNVVAWTANGHEVLPLVAREQPDIVLLDVRMPGLGGLAALDALREQHPDVTVLVVADADEPQLAREATQRGAHAYLRKPVDLDSVAQSINEAVEGGERSPAQLSRKERDVLTLVAEGLSNRQIADQLWISEPTVKLRLTKIYRKLGVSNRTQAALTILRSENEGGAKTWMLAPLVVFEACFWEMTHDGILASIALF
jgi:DNA-binding NarL/FixJ family response regulator